MFLNSVHVHEDERRSWHFGLHALTCRRENSYNDEVLAQARNLWPYGGPWGTTDEFPSNSPELLRLHRIAPLPSGLPNLRAPLVPQLQPGFTAAQALRRVAVRAPTTTNTDLQHACFLNYLRRVPSAPVHLLAGKRQVQAGDTLYTAVSDTANHHVLKHFLSRKESTPRRSPGTSYKEV